MLFNGWKTTVELKDLGDLDPAWNGIYSPLYKKSVVSRYLHRQFLEDAGEYLDRYQATDYWKGLLMEARRFFTVAEKPRILDLGSGGGNTVLPLLELYPDAEIVASDLSLPLLRALRDALAANPAAARCRVLQLNAERIVFAAGQVDLVVGGAILHHLRSPARALAECARVLRPGGVAVFFEPFLAGYRVVAESLENLLARDRGRLPPRVRDFFLGIVHDFRVRASMNRFTVRFRHLDDKWLFTPDFFTAQAQKNGFLDPTVYPLQVGPRLLFERIHSLIHLGLGNDKSELPGWALAEIDAADARLAAEPRQELLIEGAVILKKQ